MNDFFGLHIAPHSLGGMTMALVLAVILAGLIGLERELHGHPAGLRTHILVCVGATLMTLVSVHVATLAAGRADPGRIAAQIVSGIGFLGAGAIIREGASIRGLTTAASIWTTAGIGIALGAGPYYGELAVVTTAIVLFTLWGLNLAEAWIERKGGLLTLLELHINEAEQPAAPVFARVAAHGIVIHSIQCERSQDPHIQQYILQVRLPAGFDRMTLLSDLSAQPGVQHVSMD